MNKNLGLTIKDKFKTAPFIVGSIINGEPFRRKLQMLRSELFTLFSISESNTFMQNKKQIRNLKRGLMYICSKNQEIPMDIEKDKEEPWFPELIKGWSSVLDHMVNKNFLYDHLSVNQPDDLDDGIDP